MRWLLETQIARVRNSKSPRLNTMPARSPMKAKIIFLALALIIGALSKARSQDEARAV